MIEKQVRLNIKDWRRDIAGRILQHNINGQITSYDYDEESPVPSLIKTPCGYKFSCVYDKVFRLLTVRTEIGEFSFSYTPMNKIVAEQKNIYGRVFSAQVKKVDKDKIQAHLIDVDEKYTEGTTWFPFATPYSSADGSGAGS